MHVEREGDHPIEAKIRVKHRERGRRRRK